MPLSRRSLRCSLWHLASAHVPCRAPALLGAAPARGGRGTAGRVGQRGHCAVPPRPQSPPERRRPALTVQIPAPARRSAPRWWHSQRSSRRGCGRATGGTWSTYPASPGTRRTTVGGGGALGLGLGCWALLGHAHLGGGWRAGGWWSCNDFMHALHWLEPHCAWQGGGHGQGGSGARPGQAHSCSRPV